MDEIMSQTEQKVEVSIEEGLLEEVQRKKQQKQVSSKGQIIPNNKLLGDIEEARQAAMNAKKRLDNEGLHIGDIIIGDNNRVKGDNIYKVVSDIHETLNRLKDEITKEQENTELDQQEASKRASMARMYINKVKQEVEEEKPNKRKMFYYLKKVGQIAGCVAKKVTAAGEVVTTFGEAVNTVQSLFGKK